MTDRLPRLYARSLRNATHTRRFAIHTGSGQGWEVRDENDGTVLKHVFYRDWHRVERAIALFALEAHFLRAHGWDDEPSI